MNLKIVVLDPNLEVLSEKAEAFYPKIVTQNANVRVLSENFEVLNIKIDKSVGPVAVKNLSEVFLNCNY